MIYSSHKAAHHLDRISALRKGEMIYPTQVQIDLTNSCNHKCPYCFYRHSRNEKLNALFNEKDIIPTERMLKLVDEFKELGVPAVQYTGGGEPFDHPGIYEILDHTIKNGLEMAIVTNGGKVDPNRLDILEKCSWIRFSLDASSAAMHSITHGTDREDFDRIVSIIKALVDKKGPTVVGLSFVVNPINYKEMLNFTAMASKLGVNNVRFSVAYTPRGIDLFRDIWEKIEDLAKQCRKFNTDKFKVFDLAREHLCNLDMRDKGYNFCGYQHFTAVIGADSVLYPCCTLKYNSVSNLGSLKDHSFKELWTGEKRTRWLKMDHLKAVCDKNPCWMDSKNKFIDYLIQNDPPHVNYI